MKESGLSDLFRNRPLPTPMASDGMKGGAGGGAGSTYPLRMILATPRKTDADRGGRGDVLSQLRGHSSRHAGMMGTPKANAAPRGSVLRRHKGRMTSGQDCFDRSPTIGEALHFDRQIPEILPTPTKRDSRMDGWSPAYDRRKSPTMGGCAGAGGDPAQPWPDWNGGLAHHLRMDDGVSAWLARTRIALGSRKGTSAASLIVEVFGDAVVPQIPEAIGRAILRTEAALNAVLGGASESCVTTGDSASTNTVTGDVATDSDAASNAPTDDPADHGGAL